jgi:hypothetical protein
VTLVLSANNSADHASPSDGKPLAAGTYQVRLTNDQPTAAVGESPGAERWVEFVNDGKAAGREIATVIAAAALGTIVKGPQAKPNGSRVDLLKGGDYIRVWINKSGTNSLVNLPRAR